MPKNVVPRDNNERKQIRKDEKNINELNKDVPKGAHQPIGEKWKVQGNENPKA